MRGGPPRERGDSSEPERLREFATTADGWFTWSEVAREVEFVPMGRWLVMYRAYVSAQTGEPTGDGQSE